MRKIKIGLAQLLFWIVGVAGTATAIAGEGLPTITLPISGQQVTAEVATTDTALQHGLQGRRSMPENAGMLLVLPDAALRCVWMKDTPLALSAAFLDETGTVIMLADMEPLSLDFHCSTSSARYVLEMNRGWFARYSVAVGARLDLGELQTNKGR